MNTIVAQRPALNIIKIADGAKDNWRFLSDVLLPKQGTEALRYWITSMPVNT